MINRSNVLMHEFIGLEAKVAECACREMKGISGRVVDETKNTLVIRTSRGEKTIPKKGSVFCLKLGNMLVKVDGNRIAMRLHDRPKKLL